MDAQAIVTQLREQRDRIDAIIAALEGIGEPQPDAAAVRRSTMSADATYRLAMKKRWAQRKKVAAS